MKLGVLFSGGKDSCYAAYLAKKSGYELVCLISIFSKNSDSFMFHTPSVKEVGKQAEVMRLPIVVQNTKGKKEDELADLEKAIRKAKEEFGIEGIVTGAIQSVYQATRIQKICNELDLECFNPLWQKDEFVYLEELIKNKFKVIITGVAAYPLSKNFLGKEINRHFLKEIKELNKEYKIHAAGEGGEFETFVLNCPLFKRGLESKNKKISGEGNNWRMEVSVK